jgi:ABC-type nickel/cobalt efflux system permease component RcnA
MIYLLSIIVLGFFLGMRHATDPDHVIAVSTIVARHRSLRDAVLLGALWGFGHTLTIVAVGGAIVLVGWVIPARIGLSMEFSVGLMLILLGIMNLSGILQRVTEALSPVCGPEGELSSHPHGHRDYLHTHPHGNDPGTPTHGPGETPLGWVDLHFSRMGIYQILRPLIVGMVHGLAGSAAVALLVLTTIRDPRWAVTYLFVFGVGTIAGMMLITGAIAVPFAFTGKRFLRVNRAFRVASGLISLGFGLFIAYQIGFVNGLFTGHPQWTPR